MKEPLLHFLLIGAALFLVFDVLGRPANLPGGQQGIADAQIVVSRDAVDRVFTQFERTWQRKPSDEERKGLIEDLVRSEIYYREAIAIGLDRDDEVLKRRLRQRMEFIYEDISSLAEPTDEDLMAFMKKHPEKYLIDPQMSFRQVYINTNKRGTSAEADARQILSQLTAGADWDSVGDPILLEPEIPLSPIWDIKKQFGDEFSRNLLEIKPGMWAGPIRSGFGLHLVFVKESVGARLLELKEARERVKLDWMAERQKELKDAAYAKIRERYTVTVERSKAEAVPLVSAAGTQAVPR